jgi:hypothetical protein
MRAIVISVRVTVIELLCYTSPLYTDIEGAHTPGRSLPTDMLTGHAAPRIESTSIQHPQGSGPDLVHAELLPTISCIGRSVAAVRIIVWYGIFQRDSAYKQILSRVHSVAVRAILMLPPPLSKSVDLPMSQAVP